MSKNKPNRNQKNKTNQVNEINRIDNETNQIVEDQNLTPEELKTISVDENKLTNKMNDVKNLHRKTVQLNKKLNQKENEIAQKKEAVENQKNNLEKEKSLIKQQQQDLKISLHKYDTELAEVNKLRIDGIYPSIIDKKIIDRFENKLKEQEVLITTKIEELATKNKEYIQLKIDLSQEKEKLNKEYIDKITLEKEKLTKDFLQKIQKKENELEKKESKLTNKEKELSRQKEEFNDDREDFEFHKDHIYRLEKKKVNLEIETLENDIENLKKQNTAIIDENNKLKSELSALGSVKAIDLMNELRNKEIEIAKLTNKIESSPELSKIINIKDLIREKATWNEQIEKLEIEKNDYKRNYEAQKLVVGEKESLQLEKEVLKDRLRTQKYALTQFKEEVDELTRASDNKVTFTSCSQMDIDYKETAEISKNRIDKDWINNVQQVIAKITNEELYYDLNTIRAFISGLAMSRFSILQGISGTGKTSLPKAFIKAIGGEFGIVEVQSGWKDRQDLIGYYNTFEKKYYEGKFLTYLYEAGTPAFRDKPFFIILDEMNLSHPEHYFADLLSVMEETDPEKQYLDISDKVSDKPELMELSLGKLKLKIPNNVWFIGTANHDETTLQFAPKTYDRANIIEMPINIEKFEINDKLNKSKTSISNKTLLRFFDKNTKTSNLNKYLKESTFKDVCNNKLDIGWGNRLEKQINKFEPVFKSLGGETNHAADHIISSKILRTLKGRYDVLPEDLNLLKGELLKSKQIPTKNSKSIQIIEKELKRLGN